jgi:hypothetical protein
MVLVHITHTNGVELVHHLQLALDPEKIVSVKDDPTGNYAVIEYGECYSRNWKPMFYQLTVSRALIDTFITGEYVGKEYLALHVYELPSGDVYHLDLQEKYIVDIREAFYWINQTKVACRKIEYVPGSFAPIIIYVSNTMASLVTNNLVTTTTTTRAVTTTTTTVPVTTTTTTAPVTTTTTTAPVTTTTTTSGG